MIEPHRIGVHRVFTQQVQRSNRIKLVFIAISRSRSRENSMATTECIYCAPPMKCSLHRHRIPRPEKVCEQGLKRPQLSGTRSRRMMTMKPGSEQSPRRRSAKYSVHGEVARRAVLLSSRPSGPQRIPRRDFQRKPSRLSRVSMAADC